MTSLYLLGYAEIAFESSLIHKELFSVTSGMLLEMANYFVKKGIILAAGDGGRLGRITTSFPKVLLPVRGKPLILHSIEALVAAGIREIAVVVGHSASLVKTALGDGSHFGVRLEYIANPDYLGGNAISVKKAESWVKEEPFVLCMGDHIIEPNLIARLLEKASPSETLCVDFVPMEHHQVAEATKVGLDSAGCICNIGKDLSSWDGLDTGVFLLTKEFFNAIDELVPLLGIHVEISDVIRHMTGKGFSFTTCDVSGCFWADVDTEEDWALLQT